MTNQSTNDIVSPGTNSSTVAFATTKRDTSKIQIKNRQDIYRALTDRETLDAILKQGLDEEHQKYKDEILEFFMNMKDKVRIEDLRFYG